MILSSSFEKYNLGRPTFVQKAHPPKRRHYFFEIKYLEMTLTIQNITYTHPVLLNKYSVENI